VVAALERRREQAVVEPGPQPGTWRVGRTAPPGHRVSVIVPFRDGAPLLRVCVDTVTATASGVDLELVLVDNGSTDPETLSLVERFDRRSDVVVRPDARAFNWAALNNAAVAAATGDVLVFLNNDIECRRAGWLEALVAQAVRPDVGAVGARLLYPDGRVQHAGVVVGMGGAAGHVLAGLDPGRPGYAGLAVLTRDVSAVTGACLATRRAVFEQLGGFDETLGLDLNDIDYCLRAARGGLRVVYEPRAELVHHESPSRGTSGSIDDIERFIGRWETLITEGDPHLNANLTRVDSSCALRGTDEMVWWREWRSSLRRS
jgi:GT2 family glycosyltransferase